jgi:hypothetical protein
MDAALQVKIGADTAELQKELVLAQNNLRKFEAELKKATTAGEVDYLTKSIGLLKTQISRLQSTSAPAFASITKSKTNFLELGRVLQDLPFGFQGIQNNLTQLVPAAGLAGLAFSALVSAITFAQTGFANWTRGMGGSSEALKAQKKAVEDAKEEQESYNKSINDAKSSAIATGAALQGYVNIAKDSSKSLAERNTALKEANKILGEHGQLLTLVNVGTKEVTEQVENFTRALVAQNLVSKFSDRIGDLIIKQRELRKELGANAGEVKKFASEAGGLQGNDARDVLDVQKDLIAAQQKYNSTLTNYNFIGGQIKSTYKDLNETQSESVGLMSKLGTKQTEKEANAMKKAAAEAKKLVEQRQKLLESIRLFNLANQKNQFAGDPGAALPYTPVSPAGGQGLTIPSRDFGLEKGLDSSSIILAQQEQLAGQNAYNEALARTNELAGSLSPIFESVFSSIAQGQNVFQSMGNAIKGLIAKLAAAAAAAFALSIITGGIGGKIVGGGQVGGFANFFKQFSGFKFNAAGGIFDGPTVIGRHVFGEAGPEALIPLDRLAEMMGNTAGPGGGGDQTGRFVVSGTDLVLVLERAQRSNGRRY